MNVQSPITVSYGVVALALVGCGGNTACGPGTHPSGGECLLDSAVSPTGTGGSESGAASSGNSTSGGSAGSGGNTSGSSTGSAGSSGSGGTSSAWSAGCAEPGTVVDVYDLQGAKTLLEHSWYHCSGSYLFNTPSTGIEIDPDGTWYRLDDVGGNSLKLELGAESATSVYAAAQP